jgi:hypothetical protein
MVASWLSETRRGGHASPGTSSSGTGPTSKSFDLTVIDCTTSRLVLLPVNEVYLALSYVWGSVQEPGKRQKLVSTTSSVMRSISKLENGGLSLPLDLPRTIQDSITVCKALQYRYVWIDRYCIPQKDAHARTVQTNRMDEIYHNADVTLIACAGADPSYGLPGVSIPRKRCPALHLGEPGYLQMIPTVCDIDSSVWATRAWTYQEALLATRRLYFTDRQLYFETNERVESELTTHSRFSSPVGSGTRIHARTVLALWVGDILQDIVAYSRRSLCFTADILRAFSGILAFYEHNASIRHHWDIPCSNNAPASLQSSRSGWILTFEESLQWSRISNPARPRLEFPSWSWVGWDGEVTYEALLEPREEQRAQEVPLSPSEPPIPLERETDDLKVEIELTSGELLSWDCYQQRYQELRDNDAQSYSDAQKPSKFIHIEAHTAPTVRFSYLRRYGDGYAGEVGMESNGGEVIFLGCAGKADTETVVRIEVDMQHRDMDALDTYTVIFFGYCGAQLGPTGSLPCRRALLVRQVGDHWERVALLQDKNEKMGTLKKVRRKIRLG